MGEEVCCMLRRAARCMVIALVAAIFGFTGILRWTAVIAQSVFFVCSAMCVLSLLFSLFEEAPAPDARPICIKPARRAAAAAHR